MPEGFNCPHCAKPVRMDESERYCRHTTYWGEGGPKEDDCPHCGVSIFVCEHVSRSWTAHASRSEALEA